MERRLLLVVSLLAVLGCGASPNNQSRRMKLIHVLNSPESPHYRANLTFNERISILARMDNIRRSRFHHHHHSRHHRRHRGTTMVSTGTGVYTVRVSMGTPTQEVTLIADTGSDLLWVQCGRYFRATQSSSFRLMPCSDQGCALVGATNDSKCVCPFTYCYGLDANGASLVGSMGFERVTLDGISNPRVAIGCATKVSKDFSVVPGLLGLGRGPLSVIVQTQERFGFTFSYCLVDFHWHQGAFSYLKLGRDRIHLRNYTPLLGEGSYNVQVVGLLVGHTRVPVDNRVWDIAYKGGTIFDSGTTMTFLLRDALEALQSVYVSKVKLAIENRDGFDLCFYVSGLGHQEIEAAIPSLSFALEGGAVFKPPFNNYFLDSSDGDFKCLGFYSAPNGPNILGNLLQQGFHIENDIRNTRVGFAYTGCR